VPEWILPTAIAVAIMLLVAFPVHEFSHAWAAYQLGDGTAKLFGRLTLNPLAHFDPAGGLLLVLSALVSQGTFAFGWAKPTPVNIANLRGRREGEAIVALAGPVSNLVLAAAAAIPLRFLRSVMTLAMQYSLVHDVLVVLVVLNVLLMLFNLVPVPPLDGSKVLYALLPPQTAWQVRPVLEQYGTILLLFLVFFPFGDSFLWRVLGPLLDGIVGVLVGS
jgi:Zn-dependent protease